MIHLTEVRLDEEAERRVLDVLRSGRLAQGPVVVEFEDAFAKIAGTRCAVATSSGTTALVAAVQALRLGPGDEVITSPLTFVATLNAILEAGAVARFVDIDPVDFTMDPDQVASAISPATKAIMPVHLYGCPADMDRLEAIATGAGVALIEDAAQAHGAQVGTRPVGSWGLGAFSFYATKNITTGEGGMVTTDDESLADTIRLLRSQGMRTRYQYELPGHNYRMTEVHAAIGLSQLAYLDQWTDSRRANAAALTQALAGVPGIDLPRDDPHRRHVFHQYTIRVRADARLDRDALATALRDRDVETGVYYPKVCFDYACYKDHPSVKSAAVPNAEEAARQVLSLPVHQWLTATDIAVIADAVASVLGP